MGLRYAFKWLFVVISHSMSRSFDGGLLLGFVVIVCQCFHGILVFVIRGVACFGHLLFLVVDNS